MDPNANLAEQDDLIRLNYFREPDADTRAARAERLEELRAALREWIARGGFAPDWTRYPVAAKHYRTWAHQYYSHAPAEAPEPPRYNWQVLRTDDRSVWLRIPHEKARPVPGGCQCPWCKAHPDAIPAWDVLIVPLRPGSYAVEIHGPELHIEHARPVTGPDPRD